jgi:ACS family tartrate transporter-like MFS transporter
VSLDELIDDLAHPNLTVRIKATNEIVERFEPKVIVLTTCDEPEYLKAAVEVAREKALRRPGHRMTVLEALRHPKVLLLACAYFFIVTGSYGVEFFLPSILQQWYALKFDAITWLVILPPLLALFGQLFVGWNSDRLNERRLHAVTPIIVGATALALAPMA